MAAKISDIEKAERENASEIINEQIKVEGELIGLYEKTMAQISNQPIQLLFKMISMDSQKHIEMLQASLEVIRGEEIFMEDRKTLVENLKKHLELEAKSIERGDRLLSHRWLQDQKGLRAIIESWRDEERRHHKFLKDLSEKPFIPISGDDLATAFRDEEFFEERYKRSKKYWEKGQGTQR